jgi:PAS domain S-box-containing protein
VVQGYRSGSWRVDETYVRVGGQWKYLFRAVDIIGKNLTGIITSWNRGAFLLFGYTEDGMTGQSILRLIPTELHYEEDEILLKLRSGEKIEHYETTRLIKNGESLDVSVTISSIRNRAREIIGASKIARDISCRKRWRRFSSNRRNLAFAAVGFREFFKPRHLNTAGRTPCSPEVQQDYLAFVSGETDRCAVGLAQHKGGRNASCRNRLCGCSTNR